MEKLMGRPDGYYLKNVNPYQKIMPHIMKDRSDAMNMGVFEFNYEPIEQYIEQTYKETGVKYSYMDIITCALIRLFAMRPSLNRFVMHNKIYQHNDITLSFVVKKKLQDNSDDTTVKIHFTGEETLAQVKEQIDKVIAENTGEKAYNGTDNLAKTLTTIPHWVIRIVVGLLIWLDKHNLLPKSVIEFSPFHNSLFVTYLKSINGDSIYHHCYNFGTTGIFIALGKEKSKAVVECGEIKIRKMMDLRCVMDERFCDGMYFVNSMRLFKRLVARPKLLEQPYKIEETLENGLHDKETKEMYEQLRKQRAQKIKEEKKQAKIQARLDAKKAKEEKRLAKKQQKNK